MILPVPFGHSHLWTDSWLKSGTGVCEPYSTIKDFFFFLKDRQGINRPTFPHNSRVRGKKSLFGVCMKGGYTTPRAGQNDTIISLVSAPSAFSLPLTLSLIPTHTHTRARKHTQRHVGAHARTHNDSDTRARAHTQVMCI